MKILIIMIILDRYTTDANNDDGDMITKQNQKGQNIINTTITINNNNIVALSEIVTIIHNNNSRIAITEIE